MPPVMPAAVVDDPLDELADAPSADRVGEIPTASHGSSSDFLLWPNLHLVLFPRLGMCGGNRLRINYISPELVLRASKQ
jgi:hypothetical protein